MAGLLNTINEMLTILASRPEAAADLMVYGYVAVTTAVVLGIILPNYHARLSQPTRGKKP